MIVRKFSNPFYVCDVWATYPANLKYLYLYEKEKPKYRFRRDGNLIPLNDEAVKLLPYLKPTQIFG